MKPPIKQLLLVDDDDAFRMVAERGLGKRGYQVHSCNSCEAAEQWLLSSGIRPDHVLLDLKMGGESGLTLIPRLRILHPDCRIVMLTGFASISTAVEAIKLGATHYLPKPASLDDIIAAFGKVQGDEQQEVANQPMSVDRLEWEHIQKVLAEHEGNISATARALNMHRRTLQRKLGKRPVRQ